MTTPARRAPSVRDLIEAIATGDSVEFTRLLDAAPELAAAQMQDGATRRSAAQNLLPTLGCYVYAGDTPLHIAAAAWRADLIRRLVACGAEPTSHNRRGATPLHHAASGNPESRRWDPDAQAEAIALLVTAGGDPNAVDNNGSTPLHKAIRTRCAAAVQTLLRLGADPTMRTRNGSTCERLASVSSGRGGSGSDKAKEQQAQILSLLREQRGPAAPARALS